MDNTWIGFLIVVLTIIGSRALLHRDLVALRERMTKLEMRLRERMAKLEGVVEGFIAAQKTA